MKKIFLMAILSMVLINCNNDDNEEQVFTPQVITPILIAQGDGGGISIPDMNPYNNYFNNENDWDYFISNHFYAYNYNPSYYPEMENIDFSNDTVIVCVDYSRPTNGFSIGFNSIIEYQNEIIVSINYIDNGGVAAHPSRPFIIVKIPKTEKPIVFE